MKLAEATSLVHSHTASQWWPRDSNQEQDNYKIWFLSQ